MGGEYGATGRSLPTAETSVALLEEKIQALIRANLNCGIGLGLLGSGLNVPQLGLPQIDAQLENIGISSFTPIQQQHLRGCSVALATLGLFNSSSMEAQVTAAAKATFYHLRRVRQLAPYLSSVNLATVIHALVTSRFGYFNSLYMGLHLRLIWTLQLVENAAARLVSGAPLWAHIQRVLCQLHWLPVEYRIRFKVLTLTFKALNGLGPSYLRDRFPLYIPQRELRSQEQLILEVLSPRNGQRFFCPGPILVESVPE